MAPRVTQLRTVLTVTDLDAARTYYRDVLGLSEAEAISGPDGAQVVILDAGRATLELANLAQARYIADVETGGLPSSDVRLALEVHDATGATEHAAAQGVRLIAAPTRTPWDSLNSRLEGPQGIQVTLFQELGAETPGAEPTGAEPKVAAELAALVGSSSESLGGEPGLLLRTVGSATRHGATGQMPFTAVVVRDGVVIGTGVNTALAGVDPSGHGEVVAIRDAARRVGSADLRGAVVLSSCEPCAMCRLVADGAGVTEIVFAAPKESVPTQIDASPEVTARLVEAVTRELTLVVRQGPTDLAAAELSAPFAAYLATRDRSARRAR
ncbi:VOC family protein [Actinotalea sp. K2]|uniref:VOC family protein n=1 Tax=Actinotalea sp. K2 TaxID=2939438 RepID=UPI002017F472|nr:VOC family protein [Actinotalea sp. K2]MCL3860822.1 deaminase [Actinotalea sp. K2]